MNSPTMGEWLEHLESPVSAPDALGRLSFVSALCEALVRSPGHRSAVTAVYGPWGSGKTWLLEQVVKQMQGDSRMVTCRFSPWELKSHDQILAEFFTVVGAKIGVDEGGTEITPLWEQFENVARVAQLGAAGVMGTLAATGVVPSETAVQVAISTSAFRRILCLFRIGKMERSKMRTKEEKPSLTKLKSRISTALQDKLRTPILIIIDDLDRLTHPEIQMMIRLLNTTANLPKLHYLIFGDRQQIASALDPIAGKQGDRYLEKIVQNSFQLPEPGEDAIQKRLWEGFSQIVSLGRLHPDDFFRRYRDFWQAFLQYRLTTFRDCHRLLRTFSFHVGALTNEGILEADPIDLLGVDFLRLFDPGLYQAIATHLPNEANFGDRPGIKSNPDSPTIQSIVEASSLGNRTACSALFQLFPRTYQYLESFLSEQLKGQQPSNTGNVGTPLSIRYPDRTRCYFTLEIPTGGIPEHTIREFFKSTDQPEQCIPRIKEIVANGWTSEVLNRILQFPHYGGNGVSVTGLLRALAEISDDVDHSLELPGVMATDFIILEAITDRLIGEIPKAGQQQELSLIITQSEGLTLPLALIEKLRHRSGTAFRTGLKSPEFFPQLQTTEIEMLCDKLAPKVGKALIAGTVRSAGTFAYRMAHALGPERCENLLRCENIDVSQIWGVFHTIADDTVGPGGTWPDKFSSNSPAYRMVEHLRQFASLSFWDEFRTNQKPRPNFHPTAHLIFAHFNEARNNPY